MPRAFAALVILFVLSAIAATGCTENAPPTRSTKGAAAIESPASLCKSAAECARFDGGRVRVVGTYRAAAHPKDHHDKTPVLARIDWDGDEGPYLEPLWTKNATRSAEEMKRLDGKRVYVTGIYYRMQPRNPKDPPHAEAMGGPCIAEIEELKPE